jgi:MFS family permease
MIQKHKEKLNNPAIRTLHVVSFLLGAASAFVIYLESDYLKTATHSENITYFYIVANLIALILVVNWHHFLRLFGKSKVYLATLFIKGVILLALSFLPVSLFSAWVLAAYMILTVLMWIDLDILLETCSIDKKTGKIRGIYMTIVSAGYLASPLFVGIIVNRFGFQSAFAASFAVIFVVFLISVWKLRDIDHYHPKKSGLMELIRKVKNRKNILRAYYVSFLMDFFYALMVIYTPLYLLDLGFGWTDIGIIFTIMLVPFVLTTYPAGILVDKYIEERDLLLISLFITAISTTAIFFITSDNFVIWAVALFCTRVGSSLVDVAKESYFYKRIDCQDIDIIDFFRTVRPIAYVIGPLIATPIIYFLHIKYIFPVIGLIMLTGIFAAKNMASSRILLRAKH